MATSPRTATIRCRDGDHTLELKERELVAQRLLQATRKHSFDPDTDVDWDSPVDQDTFFMPPALVSLYETPLWDAMSHRQRVELSKREWCSIVSFGITSELALMNGLIAHAVTLPYETGHWAYALTEVEEECRHSKMFARMIDKFGVAPTAPRPLHRHSVQTAGAFIDPLRLFAGVLVVEEFADAIQRSVMADESIQPICRQVSRIHVIEESRHIRYAHEELKRQAADSSATRRRLIGFALAQGIRLLMRRTIDPSCYRAVGINPRQARRLVKASPHRRQTEAWTLAKALSFLSDVGLVDGPARGVWIRSGMLAPAA